MLIVAVELEKVPKPSGFQRTFIISDRHRTSEVYQGIREVKYLTHRIKFAPYKLLVRYLQLGKIRGVLFLQPLFFVQRSRVTRWSGPSRNASSIASGDPGDRFVALASVQAIGGIPLSIDESEVFGRVALSPRQLLDVVDGASRSFLHLAFL